MERYEAQWKNGRGPTICLMKYPIRPYSAFSRITDPYAALQSPPKPHGAPKKAIVCSRMGVEQQKLEDHYYGDDEEASRLSLLFNPFLYILDFSNFFTTVIVKRTSFVGDHKNYVFCVDFCTFFFVHVGWRVLFFCDFVHKKHFWWHLLYFLFSFFCTRFRIFLGVLLPNMSHECDMGV